MSTEQRIIKESPALAWMLKDKELKPLLLSAFGKDTPFDSNVFDSKLWATDWWKSRGSSARDWQRLKAMDPAQAKIQLNQGAQMLSRKLGLPLNQTGFLRKIVELGIVLDLDEATLLETAVNMIDKGKVKGVKFGTTGQVGAIYTQIKNQSKEYMLEIGHKQLMDLSTKMLAGRIDGDVLSNFFQREAKSKWPHLGDVIDSGVTPGEYFQGHRAAISGLLEYGSTDEVNLTDRKWKRVTSFNDGKETRPMTIAETEKFVRGTEAWGETRNAAEEASGMAETILTKFGGVA